MDIRDVEFEDVEYVHLPQDRVLSRTVVNAVMTCRDPTT